ncbi:WD repeat domain-containing protein 83 isoform X1 [Apteryx mantelli]|uniref:WD repeat domain-containing protein 83 n=1 Tax=Apteryx mantelli TaxID=2696672 RepID=A0ABM4G0G4_9AVES
MLRRFRRRRRKRLLGGGGGGGGGGAGPGHGLSPPAARPRRAAAPPGAQPRVRAGRRARRPLQRGRELLPDLRQRQVPEALEPAQGHPAAHLPRPRLRGAGRRRLLRQQPALLLQRRQDRGALGRGHGPGGPQIPGTRRGESRGGRGGAGAPAAPAERVTPRSLSPPAEGSIDSTVRCWDCRSRRPDPVQVLDEAKDGVSSVKVSDHELLSGSVDGRVRRYDLRAGQLYSDYVGSPITSVCFSKDGQCVLAASLDSTLRLLDKDTGELLGEYTGHRSTTYKLDCVLSEQDTHVGSASEDGKVYFWDLVEGSLALSLAVGRGAVQSLAFHPALPCLLAAAEGRLQLWREETFEEGGDAPA